MYHLTYPEMGRALGVFRALRARYLMVLLATASASAGTDWRDTARCDNDMRKMDLMPVLSVNFSRTTVTTSWPVVHAANMAIEPEGRHFGKFTLGSDAITTRTISHPQFKSNRSITAETMLRTRIRCPLCRAPCQLHRNISGGIQRYSDHKVSKQNPARLAKRETLRGGYHSPLYT